MTYEITHRPAFLTDFIELPKNLQRSISRAIEDIKEHAESPRGKTIRHLSGYKRLWRYRLGDYRMVYGVTGDLVHLFSVGPRSNIYKRYYSDPDLPDTPEYTAAVEQLLSSARLSLPDWLGRVLENLVENRRNQTRDDEALPQELTCDKLTQWRVPSEHHAAFLACKTRYDLQNCKAPPKIVERVLEHVYPRPADQIAQQPKLQLKDPNDLIRYAEGDLVGFLLKLDSEQERYIDWALDGPTLVKGGPGSGKSTVALYRAKELVERKIGTVLFTTYTNALVKSSYQLLEQLMGSPPSEIQVSTLDRIAVQIVENCDGYYLSSKGGSNEIKAALNDAQVSFAQGAGYKRELMLLNGGFQGIRKEYLVDEIEWVIEGRNIRSIKEYLATDRVGRGYGFNERTRRAMWRIYQHVQEFLTRRKIFTWGYIRSRAHELVKAGKWDKRWDAVIVDEAQDLTPTALALCIELCHDPSGLFLTADASQSLYNRGFRWKDVHDALRIVGRTRILKRNYRSTRQIARATAEILHNTGAGDEEALNQTYVHSGPRPALCSCDDDNEQMGYLAEEIKDAAQELRLPVGASAVLVRTHQLAKETAKSLNEGGLPSRYMTSKELDLQCPEVKVLTIHSAKGLEFPIVVLPYVEEGILPSDLDTQQVEDLEQHLASERRLFYVGCTRSMRRLCVLYREKHRSPFIDSLSKNAWY